MTIRRMLSHESGLPAEPPGTDWVVPAYQGGPGQTLRQAARIAVQFPPHAQHKYSDLAYQWLGEIITRVSGAAYPRYVREAILDPLGMSATGAASLRQMHKPRYLANEQWTQAWGVSWCGTRREDTVWIGHAGGIPGFTSAICFDPAAQVGAVVLFNGSSSTADLAGLARERARHALPPSMLPTPAPAGYQPLLGIYARADLGGWLLRLEWTRGKLAFTTAEALDWQIVLTPAAVPDQFTITGGNNLSGGNVTFQRLADGRVGSVHLMDSTWVRLDRVTT